MKLADIQSRHTPHGDLVLSAKRPNGIKSVKTFPSHYNEQQAKEEFLIYLNTTYNHKLGGLK